MNRWVSPPIRASAKSPVCGPTATILRRPGAPPRPPRRSPPKLVRLLAVAGEARVQRAVRVVAGQAEVADGSAPARDADRDDPAVRLDRHVACPVGGPEEEVGRLHAVAGEARGGGEPGREERLRRLPTQRRRGAVRRTGCLSPAWAVEPLRRHKQGRAAAVPGSRGLGGCRSRGSGCSLSAWHRAASAFARRHEGTVANRTYVRPVSNSRARSGLEMTGVGFDVAAVAGRRRIGMFRLHGAGEDPSGQPWGLR